MTFAKKILSMVFESEVVAHIEGPPGAGKTTLLANLQRIYPSLTFKDIDLFIYQAAKRLGLNRTYGFSEEEWEKLGIETQKIMDKWIGQKKKPIVLGGILGTFGRSSLAVSPEHKYLLNTPAYKSAWRALGRLKKNTPGQPHPLVSQIKYYAHKYGQAKETIKHSKLLGYKPTSPEQIMKEISRISSRR